MYKDRTVIVKSTVLPGTTEMTVIPILEQESGKKAFLDFGMASNPEFLKEGTAVEDFFHADRVVIGVNDERTGRSLCKCMNSRRPGVFHHDPDLGDGQGHEQRLPRHQDQFRERDREPLQEDGHRQLRCLHGVGMDSRIGHQFFRSGIGFGGSCFPKDVRALIAHSRTLGIEPLILDA